MPRPPTGGTRTAMLADGRVAHYARFTDQYGKRREECVGYDLTEAEVKIELRELLDAVREGTYVPPERREPNRAADMDTFLDVMSDSESRESSGTTRGDSSPSPIASTLQQMATAGARTPCAISSGAVTHTCGRSFTTTHRARSTHG
jgi:hypothetical protein